MLRACVAQRVAVDVAEIERLPRMDDPADEHTVDLLRVHARSTPRAPHPARGDRLLRSLPTPVMVRVVDDPMPRLRALRPRHTPPAELRAEPLLRHSSNERAAARSTLSLLGDEAREAAPRARPLRPLLVMGTPARRAAQLSVAGRDEIASAPLTTFRPGQFVLVPKNLRGEISKLRGSSCIRPPKERPCIAHAVVFLAETDGGIVSQPLLENGPMQPARAYGRPCKSRWEGGLGRFLPDVQQLAFMRIGLHTVQDTSRSGRHRLVWF